jgi:processing peptidase subunit beta
MIPSLRRQLQSKSFVRGVSQVLAEPTVWNQTPAIVTTLANGLRVVSKETCSDVSSVGMFVEAGVRNETAATAGSARILERLALTGTSKRPADKLEFELGLMGGEMKVSAGREQTSFTISGGDVRKSVAILADVVADQGIANFSKERESTLRSIDETEMPNRSVLFDRLHMCAFRDIPLGFTALGPFDNANALTEDHLRSFVSSNYSADKMVLVAAGNVNHGEVVEVAESSFGNWKSFAPSAYAAKPYFCGSELLYRNDEMGPTAHICLGFESVPWKSPDAITFMVMQWLIGNYKKGEGLVPGNISGNRTVNSVANKMEVGCADEFEGFNTFYKDTGMFGFYAACDEVAVEHCVGEMMFGIGCMSFSVTDEEVARAKRELKASLLGGCTSSSAVCAEVGKHMLAYGRSIPASEMVLRIDAVDAEEVKRVAWKYLNDAEVSVTALGPLHGFPQFMDIRRATNMHRY